MIQITLFTSTLLISALLIIAVFGRKKRSKTYKIAFLLIGDILLVVSLFFIYPFPKYSMALPITTFSILNLLAIRKIFGPENPGQEILNAWHDDPANWKWGVIYYNPQDKRIFPPKKIEGAGWTINFANPYSIMGLLGLLAVAGVIEYVFVIKSST